MSSHRAIRPIAPVVLGLCFWLVLCTSAGGQLTIVPIIVETRAYPGGVRTFTVSIANNGDRPLGCTIGVSAMDVRLGGLPVEVEDAPRTCRDWITVIPQEFRLEPGEGKRVVCQVRVPKETGGGYYAILSCHGVPEETSAAEAEAAPGIGAGIRLTHRALVPVLLTVPAPQVRAVIDAAPPTISAAESGRGYVLDLPVRNRGNIHCRMGGTVEVRSEAGQLIHRFELKAGRGFILPMHERLFRGRLRISLPDGAYQAGIRLEAEDALPMRNVFPFYVSGGRPTVAELTDELREKLMKQSAGFTVTPPEMFVSLRAGGERMQAVELANLTKEVLRVRAKLLEWYRGPDGRDLVSPVAPPHGRSGLDWVALREQEIELRPLSRQRVSLVVSLPKTAAGERYAAVVFDRADVQLDASPAGRARRSAVLRLHAQGTGARRAEVTDFQAIRKPNGMLEFTARLQNTGDLSISPEAGFSIEDAEGRLVGKAAPPSAPFLVQAGGECVIRTEWPRVLDPGDYTAQVTIRYSPKDPPIMKQSRFVIPQAEEPTNPPQTAEPATPAPAAPPKGKDQV